MKYSIVTVCYNAENDILKTILSVYDQLYTDYEYIIVDGKSTDSTFRIAQSQNEKFISKGVNYKLISETDSGIYNAMNKAINICEGQYVLFMNAADTFYDENVLLKISQCITMNTYVLYGDTIGVDQVTGRQKFLKAGEMCEITQRLPFCHQSVVMKLEILKKYKFDEKYRICADYDLFFKVYRDYPNFFVKINSIVSYYSEGGYSTIKQGIVSKKEMLQIRKSYNVISEMNYFFLQCKILIKQLILLFKEYLNK